MSSRALRNVAIVAHVDHGKTTLVDARRGRRMLATGGFAMHADGTTHTPH